MVTLTCICAVGGTLADVRYRDEIFDPNVKSYAGAIGDDIIIMMVMLDLAERGLIVNILKIKV